MDVFADYFLICNISRSDDQKFNFNIYFLTDPQITHAGYAIYKWYIT